MEAGNAGRPFPPPCRESGDLRVHRPKCEPYGCRFVKTLNYYPKQPFTMREAVEEAYAHYRPRVQTNIMRTLVQLKNKGESKLVKMILERGLSKEVIYAIAKDYEIKRGIFGIPDEVHQVIDRVQQHYAIALSEFFRETWKFAPFLGIRFDTRLCRPLFANDGGFIVEEEAWALSHRICKRLRKAYRDGRWDGTEYGLHRAFMDYAENLDVHRLSNGWSSSLEGGEQGGGFMEDMVWPRFDLKLP